MKKLIAIVLALVCMVVLVGCNNYSFLGEGSGDSATSEIETVVPDKMQEIKFSTINEIDSLPQDEDAAILNGATIGYSSLFYSFEAGMKYYRYDYWSKKYYECSLNLPDGYTDGEIVHYQGGGGSGEVIIYVKALRNDEMVYLSYLFAALDDPLNKEPSAVDELTEEQVTNLIKDAEGSSTPVAEVIVPDKSVTTYDNEYGFIEYTCDLSKFPTDNINNWFGKIVLIEDDKLLIEPGLEEGKAKYGEVAWLICEEAWAYGVGQVVTYTFRDVKAPDKEGDPLNVITLSVYME